MWYNEVVNDTKINVSEIYDRHIPSVITRNGYTRKAGATQVTESNGAVTTDSVADDGEIVFSAGHRTTIKVYFDRNLYKYSYDFVDHTAERLYNEANDDAETGTQTVEITYNGSVAGYAPTSVNSQGALNVGTLEVTPLTDSEGRRVVLFSDSKGWNNVFFRAFQQCSGLELVTLGDGITSLAKQVFYGCSALKRAIVSDSLTSIGDNCFAACASLAELELPDSVAYISATAFAGADNLVIYCGEGSYAEEYCKTGGAAAYNYVREYEVGDADTDGEININDVTRIQLFLVGKTGLPVFRGRSYADLNGDGRVSLRDATLIQMKLAGLI